MAGHLRAGCARRGVLTAAVALAAFLGFSAAQAQSIVFVRTNGNDANACTLSAPCKTLTRGVAAAASRGEVRVLDSGNFGGGVTIAKSLTISGAGNTLILSGPITVSASGVKVAFRDLLLNGLNAVGNGIVVSAADSVHLVRCEVERFTGDGFLVLHTGTTEIFVSDSIFRNNGDDGMRINQGGTTRVTVDRSRFENNADRGATFDIAQSIVTRSTFAGNGDAGLGAGLGGTITVARSTAAGNGFDGFTALSGTEMHLESSVARGNASNGVRYTDSGSISNMTVTDNATGILNLGDLSTRQNNRVLRNTTDLFGDPLTPLGGT